MKLIILAVLFSAVSSVATAAPIIVDDNNIVHAETVKYFTTQQSETPVNAFKHERAAISKDNQTIIGTCNRQFT